MKSLKFKLTGVSPLLMHNARLANPLDPFVIEIKKLTSKRKKTEDDLLRIARLEWEGGLYCNDNGLFMPGHNIHSCIINAAKKNKRGKALKEAFLVQESECPLIYKGPKTIEKLWAAEKHLDYRTVVVQGRRVMRARPIFHDWGCEFTALFAEDMVDGQEIIDTVKVAGMYIGLCDYRPTYGRFESNHDRT